MHWRVVVILATLTGVVTTCREDSARESEAAVDRVVDDVSRCSADDLVWRTGAKTTYTSYPDAGSEECVEYSGCDYLGLFAACGDEVKSESWVAAHNIVAAFPDFDRLELHDLCLRSADATIVVTVLDTCSDDDCDDCCSENLGSADALIDVESYTDVRWGIDDGVIEWADLGPTVGQGCGD